MRRIESVADEMRGQVTYEIRPGAYITVDAGLIREHGLEEVIGAYGVQVPEGRIPVFQRGKEIGSVPATFDPIAIKPMTFLYDVRPGDFRRTDKGWEASNTLGPSDLGSVPEFQRKESA